MHPQRILLCILALISTLRAETPAVETFAIFETAFECAASGANLYREVEATAEVQPPNGVAWRVPLFWDGGRVFKLRVSPDAAGEWSFTVRSTDAGLGGKGGAFTVTPSQRAGGLRQRAAEPMHFERQSGEHVWFMGDTAWGLFTDDAEEKHDRAAAERYLDTRASQGFNVVTCMALSEAGTGNRGGPPWHDLAQERLNHAYWREVDERIRYANSRGLTVGLALAWGDKRGAEPYAWRRFPSLEARQRYARYIAARYAAFDVFFLVAGEWTAEIKTRGASEDDVRREFFALGDVLKAADAHGRMIGIHPMTKMGSTREFNASAWMSFGDYQQNYSHLHARVLESRKFKKPVVNGEYGYHLRDSNGDGTPDKDNSTSLQVIRHAAWDIAMAGAYSVTGFGTTYFAGGRDGGPFDVEAAKNDPWELRIAHLKHGFELLNWWRLEPHDELVTCPTPRGEDRTELGKVAPPAATYWCLAEKGRQYAVYARGLRQSLSLQLTPEMSARRVTLFDPRTGQTTIQPLDLAENRATLHPPNSGDWLMIVTNETPPTTSAPPPLPESVVVKRNVSYHRIGTHALECDVFAPREGAGPFPAVVLIHGGGWWRGDRSTDRPLAALLAERGFVAMVIEYRLSDEAPYPAAVHDCKTAVRWLRAHAAEYRAHPAHIASAGLSAGGYLSAMLATTGDDPQFDGDGPHRDQSDAVQAAVVMGGPVDMTAQTMRDATKFAGIHNPYARFLGHTWEAAPELYRAASPLTYLDQHTPPILFMDGEYDRPGERSVEARERLTTLGIATRFHMIPKAPHGFLGPRSTRANLEAAEQIAAFLREHLK